MEGGRGNTRRPFQLPELEQNLAALMPWNSGFETPDVIAFADFLQDRRAVAEWLFVRQGAPAWDRALRFPYPNGTKLRELVVLGPLDLTLIRASAGRIARRVERHLSQRAFGYRTEPDGAAWRFREFGQHGWERFINTAVSLLQRGDLMAMCSTDVAGYYGSISLDRLESHLRDLGCDGHAVAVILSGLRKWASVDGVVGIPIGPEACGVLGNAFLIAVDQMLIALGAQHLRWMDDFKCMGADEGACRSLIDPLDQILKTQGLARSASKTVVYDNPQDAIAALRDNKLASLGYWLNAKVPRTVDELHAAFDKDILGQVEVSRFRFRFVVRALKNRRDDYAAAVLAADPELASIDPRLSAEYLASVGMCVSNVADAMLAQVGGPTDDRTDALDLHLLRALARRKGLWGDVEGDLFGSIADDGARRPPVRCWAVQAHSRSSRWRQDSVMERTEAETDPLVRRAMLTTLTKVRPGRRRSRFLRHMYKRYADLRFTVGWLEAA